MKTELPYPALFELVRHRDPGGVSGTGVVAHGVIWMDGTVELRWLSDTPSTSHWDSLADLEIVHGHNGMSTVSFIDRDPFEVEAEDSTAETAHCHRHLTVVEVGRPRPQ